MIFHSLSFWTIKRSVSYNHLLKFNIFPFSGVPAMSSRGSEEQIQSPDRVTTTQTPRARQGRAQTPGHGHQGLGLRRGQEGPGPGGGAGAA